MNQLCVDCGLEEYCLFDGAVLRFNPADPNLYARFLELEERLTQLHRTMQEQLRQARQTDRVLQILEQTDREIKAHLTYVFGPGNDFSRLMQGINLLAAGSNGLTVAENLLSALEPVLLSGAERFVSEKTRQAVEQAERRRAAQ